VVNVATIFYVATTISLFAKGCQKILLNLGKSLAHMGFEPWPSG
jgi:hypothetical protein